jgi:repressor LexA
MVQGDPRQVLEAAALIRGESFAALSRLLGRNSAWVQQYVRRGTPRTLPERDRAILARYLDIDEVALGAPPAREEGATRIARLDVRAAAGAGALVGSELALPSVALDDRLLATLGVDAADAALIRVQGDSMAETLCDGDLILVDRSQSTTTRQGGIYVIRLDGVLLVKRLRRASVGLTVVSDNTAYPPFVARPEIVGRVVWLSRALV